MNYFTSDTHFNDDRLSLFHRDLLDLNTEQINTMMITNLSQKITPLDTLYHLGDVSINTNGLYYLRNLMCKKILIKGNYDNEKFVNQDMLNEVFDEIYDDLEIEIQGVKFYLNHYPVNYSNNHFNITGHIHGLWKVQKNMINVGMDAWHFRAVSEEKLLFTYNAIKKHYDKNVFVNYE